MSNSHGTGNSAKPILALHGEAATGSAETHPSLTARGPRSKTCPFLALFFIQTHCIDLGFRRYLVLQCCDLETNIFLLAYHINMA